MNEVRNMEMWKKQYEIIDGPTGIEMDTYFQTSYETLKQLLYDSLHNFFVPTIGDLMMVGFLPRPYRQACDSQLDASASVSQK